MTTMWPMVGRSAERTRVGAALAGKGDRALLVCGPAGIGKSRVVDEAVTAASPGVVRVRASAPLRSSPLAALALVLPEAAAGAADRRTLVSTVIEAIERNPPAAIWVDDVHNLDVESSVVLFHLVDRSVTPVVLTARNGEPLPAPIVSLAELDGAATLEVGALGSADIATLLADVLGAPVAQPSIRRLAERSGGNPLLLRELVRSGLASGRLAERNGLWHESLTGGAPAGLEDLVADHALDVGPAAALAFRHLAVADELLVASAERLAGADALDELVREGLITATAGPQPTVRPAHPLFAEVVSASLSAAERREVQARLADVVEADSASTADEARIVRWRLAAGVPVDAARLTGVAWNALSVFDVDLVILAATAACAAGDDGAVVPLATALSYAGRHDEAAPAFDRAVEVADGEWPRAFAMLARTLNRAYVHGFDGSIARAHRALADEIADEGMRAFLSAEEASALAFSGQLDEAAHIGAPHVLDPQVDPLAAMPFVPGYSSARTAQGRTGEVVEALARLEATAPDLSGRAQAWLFTFRAQAEALHGNFAAAETAMARFDELAYLAMVEDVAAVLSTELRGLLALWRGDISGGVRWLGEAVALSDVPESRFRRVIPWAHLAQARALAGDAAGAGEAAEETRVAATQLPLGAGYVGQAAAWHRFAEGDRTGAAKLAGEGAVWAASRGLMTAALWCAEDALRFVPTVGAAQRVLGLGAQIDGGWSQAFSAHAQGVVDRDPAVLCTAAEQFEAMGAMLHAGEVLAVAAELYRSNGHRDPARRTLARSNEILASCPGLAPRLAPAGPEDLAVAALSGREREVATLAADGLANSDIAERLGLSRRTVEGHLARAMAKLDVTRRGDLAGRLGLRDGADA